MNEKIKEFAEQVGWRKGNILMFEWDMEKFAELIVRECMDLVIAHEDAAPEEFDKLWHHMKEHFGVE